MTNLIYNNKKIQDITALSDSDMFDMIDNIENIENIENKENESKTKLDIKNKIEDKCNVCDSVNIRKDLSAGYHVCIDCGTVTNDICEDNFKDIIYDTDKGGISRFGRPTDFFLPNSSLGTSIRMSAYSRMNVMNRWCNMTYKERSLYIALKEIETICKEHGLKQSVIDNAKIVYKRIRDSKQKNGKSIILRKKNRKRIIAACVYYGAKLQNNDRDIKEIAEIFDISTAQVNKGCNKFYDILNEDNKNDIIINNIKTSTASRFIERLSKNLKISNEHCKIIKTVAENVEKLGVASNHKPLSIAGTCVLLVVQMYDLNLNKKDIADIFGVSEVTMTNIYTKIYKLRKILINDKKTEIVLQKIKEKRKQKNILRVN